MTAAALAERAGASTRRPSLAPRSPVRHSTVTETVAKPPAAFLNVNEQTPGASGMTLSVRDDPAGSIDDATHAICLTPRTQSAISTTAESLVSRMVCGLEDAFANVSAVGDAATFANHGPMIGDAPRFAQPASATTTNIGIAREESRRLHDMKQPFRLLKAGANTMKQTLPKKSRAIETL